MADSECGGKVGKRTCKMLYGMRYGFEGINTIVPDVREVVEW